MAEFADASDRREAMKTFLNELQRRKSQNRHLPMKALKRSKSCWKRRRSARTLYLPKRASPPAKKLRKSRKALTRKT